MNKIKQIAFTLAAYLCFVLAGTLFLNSASLERASSAAYVDPLLQTAEQAQLSVIVTGSDSQAAADAVMAVGGEITSDLWLIDAVGATVSPADIDQLADQAGVQSIVANHTVNSSARSGCIDSLAPCADRPGWVTNRKEKKGVFTAPINAERIQDVAYLSDGSMFALAGEEGMGFFVHNGQLQQTVTGLELNQRPSAVLVSPEDVIYIMGPRQETLNESIVYAIAPDGQILWTFAASDLIQGMAISPDGRHLYFIRSNQSTVLQVFDAETGILISAVELSGSKNDKFSFPPLVDRDGTVYVQWINKTVGKNGRSYGKAVAFEPVSLVTSEAAPLWIFEGMIDQQLVELDRPFQLAGNKLILFSQKSKMIILLDKTNGQLLGSNVVDIGVSQASVVQEDLLLLSSYRGLQTINLEDLSLNFEFTYPTESYTFIQPSADGSKVILVNGKTIWALDTQTGESLWDLQLKGDIKTEPVVDPQGRVLVGSEGKDFLIINEAGRVETRLRLNDKFVRVVSAASTDFLLLQLGDKGLMTVGNMNSHWNESIQEIQPTEIQDEWEIVNTVAIDVGADVVHDSSLPLPDKDGKLVDTPITGAGVTVAVIDSGVYVDKHVKDLLSSDQYATEIDKQYMGQYDFVGDGLEGRCDISNHYDAEKGYCFYEWDKSKDPFGHGSHVAGIIWSQITDASTSVSMGIAPGAEVVSVRVLGDDGSGSYIDLIEGIQWVVENQNNPELAHPIRIMNLSLSAEASVPYFVDPINRAVERAWAAGIVVIAAAGNEGGVAETITVPGNDPYIITVGAINTGRTPGYWGDDVIPSWSSNGPTLDGFVKPDVVAPGSQIISFMHNDGLEVARLLQDHPDYSETSSLFRMNGTSMATGVTSGVVALMLQANAMLTPDEVKFRLMITARPAVTGEGAEGELLYSLLEQGAGRIWAPEAVFATDIPMQPDPGMDIEQDLAHGWMQLDENGNPLLDEEGYPLLDEEALSYHYSGLVQKVVSSDGLAYLYVIEDVENETMMALGAVDAHDMSWLEYETIQVMGLTFSDYGSLTWTSEDVWGGGNRFWGGGNRFWGGGNRFWGGGNRFWGGGNRFWGGSISDQTTTVGANKWIADE